MRAFKHRRQCQVSLCGILSEGRCRLKTAGSGARRSPPPGIANEISSGWHQYPFSAVTATCKRLVVVHFQDAVTDVSMEHLRNFPRQRTPSKSVLGHLPYGRSALMLAPLRRLARVFLVIFLLIYITTWLSYSERFLRLWGTAEEEDDLLWSEDRTWLRKSDGKLLVPIDDQGHVVAANGEEKPRHPMHRLVQDAERKWKHMLRRYGRLFVSPFGRIAYRTEQAEQDVGRSGAGVPAKI